MSFFFSRSEYGAFWKCIQAGGIYIFTQLVKMLALATFFPTADNVGEEGFDIFGVRIFLKKTNLLSLFHLVIKKNNTLWIGFCKDSIKRINLKSEKECVYMCVFNL